MDNRDWERFGDSIRDTVQDAIDARDFEKLSQTVADTVNHAIDSISKGMKSTDRPAGQKMQKEQPKPPNVYRRMTSVKAWSYIFLTIGGGAGLLFLLLLVVDVAGLLLGIEMLGTGNRFAQLMVSLGVFGIPSIAGGILAFRGLRKLKRAERFQTYVRIIGAREYCNIKELSEGAGRKTVSVIRDLRYMIRRNWFLEGYMVGNQTCLIVTDSMYAQYCGLEDERIKNEREESERKKLQQKREKEDKRKREEDNARLAPDIRKIIEEGDDYIRRIHACNDAIAGREISAKISRMELLVDRIFDRVEQNPESAGDIRRLMDYYLPTTVKLLAAYQELDAQPVQGENILSSKKEIEGTLDTLNMAFEKLLDDMFQETAWDVSSDISVLRTMLAQEGLAEDEWKR
ncbi:MAG: 5-bromo-4-chloroindolyl phosphate hydrolysis protein [Dorea sp.]|nr:5-bromo-4-chloroindolyl phosphate hydrolysis protein [Dorea sp.]